MKKCILSLVIFVFSYTVVFGQVLENDIEVWGLKKNETKAEFVNKLNEAKAKVCMADLAKLGYLDANVIGMDSITLVTLRENPVIKLKGKRKAETLELTKRKLASMKDFEPFHSQGFITALKNFFALKQNDTAVINQNLANLSEKDLNIYHAACRYMTENSNITIVELKAILDNPGSTELKEKAFALYLNKIKTTEQALDLLTLVIDRDLQLPVIVPITEFLKYNNITDQQWKEYHSYFASVLNSPSPFVTVEIATLLVNKKCPTNYSSKILKNGNITIKEILSGAHPDINYYKTKIYPYLISVSGQDFKEDDKQWLAYLQKM